MELVMVVVVEAVPLMNDVSFCKHRRELKIGVWSQGERTLRDYPCML
jgi:hypothetical protein